jgi:hypothetical protein
VAGRHADDDAAVLPELHSGEELCKALGKPARKRARCQARHHEVVRILVMEHRLPGQPVVFRTSEFGNDRDRRSGARIVRADEKSILRASDFANFRSSGDDEDRHAVGWTRLGLLFREQVRHGRVEQLEPLSKLLYVTLALVAVDDEVIAAGLQPVGVGRCRNEH